MIESLFSPEALPYVVPAALGFAGAAVFSLMGPMLRGARFSIGFSLFVLVVLVCGPMLCFLNCSSGRGIFDSNTGLGAFAADMWRMLVVGEKKSAEPGDDLRGNLMRYHANTLDAINGLARVKVDIAALEERMDAVEKDLAPTPLRLTQPQDPHDFTPHSIYHNGPIGGAGSGGHTPYPYWSDTPSGKPCPKPTKDLRPGDEVSVKLLISERKDNVNGNISFYFRANGWNVGSIDDDILDAVRTDNK